METKREWTSIKEYEDILFDYYNWHCPYYDQSRTLPECFYPYYNRRNERCAAHLS